MSKRGDERAERVFAALEEFTDEYGHPPSVRQLLQRVGLASTAAVHHHLRRLVASGRLVACECGCGGYRLGFTDEPSDPEPTALDLTAAALHRWRHPTFPRYSRCKCESDAEHALALLAS